MEDLYQAIHTMSCHAMRRRAVLGRCYTRYGGDGAHRWWVVVYVVYMYHIHIIYISYTSTS